MKSRSCLLACFLALCSDASASPPSFATRTNLSLPSAVFTLGDFNKDGHLDIISVIPTPFSNNGNYEIDILYGSAAGTFTQGPTEDLGPNFDPVAVAVADFNADGLLDIAILSNSQKALYIALHESGGFKINPIEVNAFGSTNMAIADVNGDNRPDILIPSTGGVLELLNKGGGRFHTPTEVSTVDCNFIAVADLNRDGKEDFVVGGVSDVYVGTSFLGTGTGTFNQASSFALGAALQFTLADFNGDGKPDLAFASQSSYPQYGLSISNGNGDGTFGSPTTYPFPTSITGPGGAVVATDLNSDGHQDAVVVTSGFLATFLNTGTGTFNSAGAYSVAGSYSPIVAGLLNGDKYPDIAISGGFDVVSVLLGNGKGGFQDGALVPSTYPEYLVTGDFNGDSLIDVAAIGQSGLTIFLNTGKTGAAVLSPLPELPFYSGPLTSADFNSDGILDIVLADGDTGELLTGLGDGTFDFQPPSFPLGGSPQSLIVGDMNGDGKQDLVTDLPSVILSNGDGTFQSAIVGDGCGYSAVSALDFNGDGKLDVMCAGGPNSSSLYLFLGNGDGTLQSPLIAFNQAFLSAFYGGDFNRDGIYDVAVIDGGPGYGFNLNIGLGLGDGTFTFQTPITLPIIYSVDSMLVTDFNNDGFLDIAILDYEDSAFLILAGNGDGTFQSPLIYGTPSDPACMESAYIENPPRAGHPDLTFCADYGVGIAPNNGH